MLASPLIINFYESNAGGSVVAKQNTGNRRYFWYLKKRKENVYLNKPKKIIVLEGHF